MNKINDICLNFYQSSYLTHGIGRRYPNEELARFIGTRFSISSAEKKAIKILDMGCGCANNLWMIAREGFDAYGIDFSPEAVRLSKEVLDSWGVEANISVADARALPFDNTSFDVILDNLALCCLAEHDFSTALHEVKRVLRLGGIFFFHTLSTGSDVFTGQSTNKKIDAYTFDGLTDPAFPSYYGQIGPVRFLDFDTCTAFFEEHGLTVTKKEKISRTYNNGQEYFEFISGVAVNG